MSNSDPWVAAQAAALRPALLRYLVRFTGDGDLAEDLAQETLVRLRERPPEDRGDPRRWLFTVATNLARDAYRRTRRQDALARRAAGRLPVGDPPPDPAAAVERGEAVRRVRGALAALKERDRAILLMREEGFTHREIAEAVGTTPKSVGTLIARALDRMAEALGPEAE